MLDGGTKKRKAIDVLAKGSQVRTGKNVLDEGIKKRKAIDYSLRNMGKKRQMEGPRKERFRCASE